VNDDDDDEIDTRSLLEKMKETVEGMKRRRSMNPRLNMSERRMSLGLGMSPKNRLATGDGKEEFSLLAPGVKEELLLELQEEDQEEDTMQAREDRGKEIDVEVYKENATEGNLLEGGGNYTNDDIEGAPTEPPVTPIRAPTVHPYETPRMDGLRNMFMAPRITSTPSYSGVRDMFVHGGVKTRQTPTFEGIGEMMRTPERYHYTPNDEVQEDLDEGEDTGAEWMLAEKSNRVKTTPASPHPLVPTIRTVAVEGVVEDEPREQEDTVVKRRGRSSSKQVTSDDGGAVQKPKARLLRGKKAVEEVTVCCSDTVFLFWILT
jgi:hypothetical protein